MNAIALQDNTKTNPTPWLSLIEYNLKGIETRRNWIRKNHRRDTLFTASQTSLTPNAGLAVCVATVVDIVPMTDAHEFRACIRLFDFASALILEDLRWLSRKFPVKGRLGVFDVEVPADVYLVKPSLEQLVQMPMYLMSFLAEKKPFYYPSTEVINSSIVE